MSQRQGRCVNFGRCPQADAGELVVVPSGEPFVCPSQNCGEVLEPAVPLQGRFDRRHVLAGTVVLLVLVLGVLGFFWYSPAARAGTSTGVTPAVNVSPTPSGLHPVVADDRPATNNDSDVCHQTDWTRAVGKDFIAVNCVGKGIASYDKRLEYVYSLNEVKDWADVKKDDPRLKDCAGNRACEDRAQGMDKPSRSLPKPVIAAEKVTNHVKAGNWENASCESVTSTWESEDPRLSTATCGGLGMAECSHIKRCLGLHDINVGPGSSKIEP